MERKTVIGTGGELLVHQLLAQGVEYAFTNTGSAEVGFFNGLLAVPGVQPILLLMEPLVLSAADGYAKASGKPAFVNIHLAAGTRQGSGQLQNAYFDGTPMVITAAMRDTGSFGDHVVLGSSGGYSQMGVVEDITKRRWEVWDPRGVPTVTRRAFQEAMSLLRDLAAPGATAIEIDGSVCGICERDLIGCDSETGHTIDCLVVRARTFLRSQDPRATGNKRGESP